MVPLAPLPDRPFAPFPDILAQLALAVALTRPRAALM